MEDLNNTSESPKDDGNRSCSGRRRACVALLAFSLIALVIAIVVAVVLTEKTKLRDISHESTMVVKLDCGPISGFMETSDTENEAFVFKGVPFAKPPTGRRRWKPPEDLSKEHEGQCWKGTFEANKYAPACAQSVKLFGPGLIGSEDCLYLNVWTKRNKAKKLRPVLVWVHGGALVAGSATLPGYAPNPDILKTIDVVAVSVPYRLNVFGFLSLDVLAINSSTNTSGNYGIMDVIKALQWVNKNIEAFGGDPNDVTVMGHSAGGKVVYALLASPPASGLFHKAISLSGPAVYTRTWKEVAKDNAVYVRKANCSRATNREILNCLYNLTTEEAFNAIPWFEFPFWSLSGINDLPVRGEVMATLAVIDGHVVAVSPLDLANQTAVKIKPVPLLISTMTQECESLISSNLTKKSFYEKVNETLGSFSKNISINAIRKYLPQNGTKNLNYGLAYINMATDVRITCPSDVFGRRLSQGKLRDVYRLVLANWPGKAAKFVNEVRHYAYHGWDTLAFFNFQSPFVGDFGPRRLYRPSEYDLKYRDFLQQEVHHFITHGYPKVKGWQKYPTSVVIYRKDKAKVQKADYHEQQCRFWNTNAFFRYGLMI